MRAIKFRGKRKDKWHYGHLSAIDEQLYIHDGKGQHEVNEESIGQFTGIMNVNDEEVYEGDIILIPPTDFNIEITGVIVFDNGAFRVRSLLSGTSSSLDYVFRHRTLGETISQIIGNVFENRELIERYTSYDEVKNWRQGTL